MLSAMALRQTRRYYLACGMPDRTRVLPFVYVSAVITLQLFDLLLTGVGMSAGHAELNPFSRAIIESAGFGGAIVEKSCIAILLIGIVLRMKQGRSMVMTMTIMACLLNVTFNMMVLT